MILFRFLEFRNVSQKRKVIFVLYDNINALCSEIGTTPTKFTTEVLKLSSSKVTAWKNGSIPKYEILQAIANYFHVTIGYLFDGGEKSSPPELTENEQAIVKVFKELTDTQQGEIIGRAKSMAEQNGEEYLRKESV